MGRAKGSPIVIQKFIRSRLGLLLELLNKIEPLRCYFPKKIVVVKILQPFFFTDQLLNQLEYKIMMSIVMFCLNTEITGLYSLVIRQMGESQNGGNKKTKHIKFLKNKHFIVCIRDKKCSFFGKFSVHCFLVLKVYLKVLVFTC